MGTKARGGITLYNVKNGKDAEYHRLRPQNEKAVVGADNSLYITLSYIIEHVNGAQVTTEVGSAQGYHVTARMNNGVSIAMTSGAVNSGTYKLTDYSKAQNRPDYVIIELRDSADKVVDIRTAQIIMEASSYVDIVADLRTTVSQHGDSISTIKQTANSVSATITSLKTGLEAVGMHMDGANSTFDIVANKFKVQTPEGKVAFVASDGTIDASRVRMRCEHGSIYFGEIDGYPNIILTNELGQPQIMLNHRGIVNKYGVDMELINASRYFVSKRDGKAYLGVNIIVKITNRGFQQNTYGGGDIKLTATLNDKSHEYITLQLGKQYTDDNKAIIEATTPITLKIGETGEMIYGGLFEIGSTSGGAVVAQKMSYSVRSVYYDTVIDKSYVSELGGNNFSSDSGGNLINPSNGDEPPAVIPAPNMDV